MWLLPICYRCGATNALLNPAASWTSTWSSSGAAVAKHHDVGAPERTWFFLGRVDASIAAPLEIWMGVAGPDRLQAWCGGIELYVSTSPRAEPADQ